MQKSKDCKKEETICYTKVFIGSLPPSMSTEDVWNLFSKHGGVHSVFLVKDRKTKRPRGFGFVTMNSNDDANKVIAGLDGIVIDDRAISVSKGESKSRSGYRA